MGEAPAPGNDVQRETEPSKELPVTVAVNVRPLLANEEARGDFECVQPSARYDTPALMSKGKYIYIHT